MCTHRAVHTPAHARTRTHAHARTHPHAHAAAPCSLEEVLQSELRASKYAALRVPRLTRVLDKYREVDKASGLAGMHRSKQAEVG